MRHFSKKTISKFKMNKKTNKKTSKKTNKKINKKTNRNQKSKSIRRHKTIRKKMRGGILNAYSNPEDIVCEGWLTKLPRSNIGSARHRYFTLEGDFSTKSVTNLNLKYFYDNDKKHRVNTVNLKNFISAKAIKIDNLIIEYPQHKYDRYRKALKDKFLFIIKLTNQKRPFVLGADNDLDRYLWLIYILYWVLISTNVDLRINALNDLKDARDNLMKLIKDIEKDIDEKLKNTTDIDKTDQTKLMSRDLDTVKARLQNIDIDKEIMKAERQQKAEEVEARDKLQKVVEVLKLQKVVEVLKQQDADTNNNIPDDIKKCASSMVQAMVPLAKEEYDGEEIKQIKQIKELIGTVVSNAAKKAEEAEEAEAAQTQAKEAEAAQTKTEASGQPISKVKLSDVLAELTSYRVDTHRIKKCAFSVLRAIEKLFTNKDHRHDSSLLGAAVAAAAAAAVKFVVAKMRENFTGIRPRQVLSGGPGTQIEDFIRANNNI